MRVSPDPDRPMDRVLRAVTQGRRTLAQIAEAARVAPPAARTYLTRLKGAGLVYTTPAKTGKRGRRAPLKGEVHKHYHARVECLLLDIWRAA